jgi:hypothetical protein
LIVAGLPLSLRELHHLTWWWLRFMTLGRDPNAAKARYHFLYFSYAPDFDYLALSMRTLRAAVPADLLGPIFLAEDQKAPFEAAQIDALRGILPSLQVLPVHDFEWGSPRSTHAELQIFKSICKQMGDPLDMLVKVDSDVLFLANAKWRRILRSQAGAVGDGHYLQHRYAQGGLYMMRRRLIEQVFADTSIADIERVAEEIDSVGEDMAISRMLADSGQAFFFTRMMLFPDEYQPLSRIRGAARQEFIALHCHKDKKSMPELATRFSLLNGQGSPT